MFSARNCRRRIEAVADDLLGNLRHDFAHVGVVGAEHGDAVEGQALQEIDEGLLEAAEVMAVGFHVVGVDVGDDGDGRRQEQEGGIGFVGLDHDEIAGAQARIGAGGVEPAADDEGRVHATLGENRRDEARRRGLAVRAGDGDALLERISSASICARGTTGTLAARAAATSGLSSLTAVDTTTASAPLMFAAACPTFTSTPRPASRRVVALSAKSEPLTVKPRLESTSAMPLMPDPPTPTKWTLLTLCFISPVPHIRLPLRPPLPVWPRPVPARPFAAFARACNCGSG
jgi:hypothetical protein